MRNAAEDRPVRIVLWRHAIDRHLDAHATDKTIDGRRRGGASPVSRPAAA